MPSLFSKKKPSAASPPVDQRPSSPFSASAARTPPVCPPTDSNASSRAPSPEKKSRGYFSKERDKEKRPKPVRGSKSFSRTRRDSDSHPLNLHPDELRRLSVLSTAAMSSPRDSRDGGVPVSFDYMETTPAPEAPGAFPTTNGVNGEHHDDDELRPAPPPHRTPKSPSPQAEKEQSPAKPEIREADAEAFKAAGNKLYKEGKYGSAIDEYTKGKIANLIMCALTR